MKAAAAAAAECFARQRAEAVARYRRQNRASVFFRDYGAAAEQLLVSLWPLWFAECEGLCLMATGGFGRGELYPHSDWDLALVCAEPLSDGLNEKTAGFVQYLWDMGLVPSVKSGTVEQLCDSVSDDITGDTAFLEARFLCGSRKLADRLLSEMDARRHTEAFVGAKRVEMQHRHAQSQGAGALLEPNIKNCPGGLRDIHTLLWMAKARGWGTHLPALVKQGLLTRTEAGMLLQGYRRLANIRIHLHLQAGREQDRLVFDVQPQVAAAMGYGGDLHRQSEALMRVFYRAVKTVKQLSGILLPVLCREENPSGLGAVLPIDGDYVRSGSRIAALEPDIFFRRPEHVFKVVEIMQQCGTAAELEPQTLRAWWGAVRKINRRFCDNPENRRRFVGFFLKGDGLTHTLRFLNLYGVLGRYMPAWENIVGLLQHDLFHIYPVDDHILTVVRNMRRLAIDTHSHELPYASALMQSFEKPHVLYLAAFFHDIAKGRGGDHALEGVEDARRFAARHFLSEADTDLLAWLVENHLLMSSVAQKEDIQNPEVLDAFCRRVQTAERLTALYLLTVSDIRGTNPKLWNTWRASLLDGLYHAAARHLAGGSGNPHTVFDRRQQQAADLLKRAAVPEKQQQKLWRALGSAYFARHLPREVLWHAANLVHDFETPMVRSRILPESDSFQVMVFMPNGERLFARLCRIFSRHGFDILAARAFVTEHNYILDTFIVQVPPQHLPDDYPNIQSALEAELNSFLHGYEVSDGMGGNRRQGRRSRLMPIAPGIQITAEEDYPDWYSVEIAAANRAFLLADIAETFAANGVNIRYAKIATLDERVEDSFIVYSPALKNPKNRSALKQDLLSLLSA